MKNFWIGLAIVIVAGLVALAICLAIPETRETIFEWFSKGAEVLGECGESVDVCECVEEVVGGGA
jgi:hypothetical protein